MAALDAERAAELKQKLIDGVSVPQIVVDMDLSYMVVYRVATGATWKALEPLLDPAKHYVSSERKRRIKPAARERLFKIKVSTNASNRTLAKKLGVSEMTVSRTLQDARSLLAARCLRMLMTSGSNEYAAKEFKLDVEEVSKLVVLASDQGPLPLRLQAELDKD